MSDAVGQSSCSPLIAIRMILVMPPHDSVLEGTPWAVTASDRMPSGFH